MHSKSLISNLQEKRKRDKWPITFHFALFSGTKFGRFLLLCFHVFFFTLNIKSWNTFVQHTGRSMSHFLHLLQNKTFLHLPLFHEGYVMRHAHSSSGRTLHLQPDKGTQLELALVNRLQSTQQTSYIVTCVVTFYTEDQKGRNSCPWLLPFRHTYIYGRLKG